MAVPLVEITGGEPLLQADVYPLMERLLAEGKTVLIETGGHRSIAGVPDGRDSGDGREVSRARARPRRTTGPTWPCSRRRDEVKFVIADRADYEFARDIVQREGLAGALRGRALLAGPRRARAAPARRVDSGRSPARSPAAADAQVHLGSADARRLTADEDFTLPAE